MKKMIETYVNKLISLSDDYLPIETKNTYDEGRVCAVDCIHEGIKTRIDILKEYDNDSDVSVQFVDNLYRELLTNLADSLKSCLTEESTEFYRGYMAIVTDFIKKIV